MKMKKIVSVTAALAMVTSAFVGLAVPANAAEDVYVQDYSSTSEVDWVIPSSQGPTASIDNETLKLTNSGQNRPQMAGYYFDPITSGIVRAKLDIKFVNAKQSKTVDVILPSTAYSGAGNAFPSNNIAHLQILNGTSNPQVSAFNGTNIPSENRVDLPGSAGGSGGGAYYNMDWVEVCFLLDISNKMILSATVTNKSTSEILYSAENVAFMTDTASYAGIYTGPTNAVGTENFYIDNISIQKVVLPTFTLDKTNVQISNEHEGQETVNVSDIHGNITVDSSDDQTATAEYQDQVITITGHKTGPATITVKAENDGYEKTQDIDVTVGAADLTTVTINYLTSDTSDQVKEPSVIDRQLVGSQIDLDTAVPEKTLYSENGDKRYIYNENKTGSDLFPYTVKSAAEGNTINVYFDVQNKVTEATLNYKSEGTTVATRTITLPTDKTYYETDPYNFVDVFYVNGTEDGKVYDTGTSHNRTVTLGTALGVDVTTLENGIYVVEGEALNSSAIDTEHTSDKLSGNLGANVPADPVEVYTIKDDGVYEITVTAYCRNTRNSSKYTIYKNSVATANILSSGDAKGASQNGPNSGTGKFSVSANDKIIICGQSGETRIDYVLLKKLSGDVEGTPTFVEKAEFKVDDIASESKTGTLRFLTKVDAPDADTFTIGKYGFKIINFADPNVAADNVHGQLVDIANINASGSESKGNLEFGDTYYYDVENIPEIGKYTPPATTDNQKPSPEDKKIVGAGFYAVPYVVSTNDVVHWGSPFTFEKDFDWTSADVQE